MRNLSDYGIFKTQEDDGPKSWSSTINSLMDTFTTSLSSNINTSSINNLNNITGNSEGPEQMDVDPVWYIYFLLAIVIIIIACLIVCVTVRIVDRIRNGKMRKRILVPSFCTKVICSQLAYHREITWVWGYRIMRKKIHHILIFMTLILLQTFWGPPPSPDVWYMYVA